MSSPLPKTLFQLFPYYLKKYKIKMLCFLISGILWGISEISLPYTLKLVIDTISRPESQTTWIWLIVLYCLIRLIHSVNFRFTEWLMYKVFPNLRTDISSSLFDYISKHSYRYFQNNLGGSIANKIRDMYEGFTNSLETLKEALGVFFILIFTLIFMAFIHPIFAIIMLAWVLAFTTASILFARSIHPIAHDFSESVSSIVGRLVDSISNMSSVIHFGKAADEKRRIRDIVQHSNQKDRDLRWKILKLNIVQDILILILYVCMLSSLSYLYKAGKITIGDFTFIMMSSTMLFHHIRWITRQLMQISRELGKCSQALKIINIPHGITEKENAKPLKVTEGLITIDHIQFQHENADMLFNDLSLSIKPGEKVGLVGFSGSGKTSFTQLILRLFDLNNGDILIDGQNIKDVTLNSIRENIAVIPQDTSLFHRSLMDNIRYPKPEASDNDVYEAARKSLCHEFIDELPKGYNSLVGERGIKLSGGQRQRIAIARAFLKDAPILILDEATSALDSVTERHIQETLYSLMEGRTTIVIAHRLSTLDKMDKIVVFDKGSIVEPGTHSQLLQKQGHYAKLWSLQAGGFLPEEEND